MDGRYTRAKPLDECCREIVSSMYCAKKQFGDQGKEWPMRVPKNKRKRKNDDMDETEEGNSTLNNSVQHEHPQTTFMECL
jgi:hypothetical protein